MNEKDGRHKPIINLMYRNALFPIITSKWKGMYLIKNLPQENNFLIEIDLKDAYFGIPIGKTSKKYTCFQWKGNLPAPMAFTKPFKVVIALLRKINV